MTFLKAIVAIILILLVLGYVWFVVQEINGSINNNLLCRTYIFIIVRLSGEIMTFIFFIIGIMITVKVKNVIKN